MRTLIVGRFRRRVDAEGHLRTLQPMPSVPLKLLSDVKPDNSRRLDPQPLKRQDHCDERKIRHSGVLTLSYELDEPLFHKSQSLGALNYCSIDMRL